MRLISGSLGPKIEERDHHSKRERAIRRRACEIHVQRGHNLALSWRNGFRPNVRSRMSVRLTG